MTRITCGLPQITFPLRSENLRESAHSADQDPITPVPLPPALPVECKIGVAEDFLTEGNKGNEGASRWGLH